MTVYNSILSGPRQSDEEDGPEEMYVILLDNNRTKLLSEDKLRVALSCIRCGACLNGCPVYKNVGGYTYNATYSGPIGSVITPYLNDLEKYKHLSYASSLCGNCSEVCPVNIPLHKLLLYIRKNSVEQNYTSWAERTSMKGLKRIMKNRKLMDFGSSKMKNWLLRTFVKKSWGAYRELPVINKRSFRKRKKIND